MRCERNRVDDVLIRFCGVSFKERWDSNEETDAFLCAKDALACLHLMSLDQQWVFHLSFARPVWNGRRSGLISAVLKSKKARQNSRLSVGKGSLWGYLSSLYTAVVQAEAAAIWHVDIAQDPPRRRAHRCQMRKRNGVCVRMIFQK